MISHDVPDANFKGISAEEFFRKYREIALDKPLAINVKSDGIASHLKRLIDDFDVTEYRCFDMSVPDARAYISSDLKILSRLSELEREYIFELDSCGVWLDCFFGEWYETKLIEGYLEKEKRFGLYHQNYMEGPIWLYGENLKVSRTYIATISICAPTFQRRQKAFFMSTIKAVIFDMDGVLIDAREWHYESLNYALSFFGFEISRADHLLTFDGLPTSTKLKMMSQISNLPEELHSLVNSLKQKHTMRMIYQECGINFIHKYALSKLKRDGYLLAVASNSIRTTVDSMMDLAKLAEYLEFTLSNEDVAAANQIPKYITSNQPTGSESGRMLDC